MVDHDDPVDVQQNQEDLWAILNSFAGATAGTDVELQFKTEHFNFTASMHPPGTTFMAEPLALELQQGLGLTSIDVKCYDFQPRFDDFRRLCSLGSLRHARLRLCDDLDAFRAYEPDDWQVERFGLTALTSLWLKGCSQPIDAFSERPAALCRLEELPHPVQACMGERAAAAGAGRRFRAHRTEAAVSEAPAHPRGSLRPAWHDTAV